MSAIHPASATAERFPVELAVNGVPQDLRVPLAETLLATLRERLALTATKRGCNQGVCGACTVQVDGAPVRACLSLACNCEGLDVRTLEGLADDPAMRALQDAFVRDGALQCGFCTPGMLMAAHALIRRDPSPDAAGVAAALSGNLCRCTGYGRIAQAVLSAAAVLRGEPAPVPPALPVIDARAEAHPHGAPR